MTPRFSLAPGYHPNLPAADYHRFRAASASALKTIHAGTPAHLKREWDEPQEPSFALQWGTLVHSLVLEPDATLPSVAVIPDTYVIPADVKPKKGDPQPGETVPWNGRARYCRDWLALQQAAWRIVLTKDQLVELGKVAGAVARHPEAKPMLREAQIREATIVWEDARQVPCKVRLDAIGYYGLQPFIVDLKTTTDASPAGFARKAWDLGYHLQAAWYVDALAESRGCGTPAFYFIAVEKDSGLVSVHQATDAFLDAGREAYRKALDQFADAWHSGVWPGYPEEIHALDVPAWARKGGA